MVTYNLTEEDINYIQLVSKNRMDEIIKNNQTQNREPQILYNNILYGNKIEYGVHKLFPNSIQNTKIFDITDKTSYMYDILLEDGSLVEVKSTESDSIWLNFNLKSYFVQGFHGSYPFYDTFINNCSELNYLITAYLKNDSITIKHLIDAKTFTSYLRIAREVSNGSTHYYDVRTASINKHCIIV